MKPLHKALIYFYVWIQVWLTTSIKKGDILYNKLYKNVASRVTERLKTKDLRKLGNILKSGLLFQNGVFSMFITNSSKIWKFVKNDSGCTLWNPLQPIPVRFKWRHFYSKNLSPFQRRHSSFVAIRIVGLVIRSKRLTYSKIPQKTENLSKMIQEALFGSFYSRCQIVSSKDTFL